MEGVQDRTRFAPYAEALDVTTDSIMAVQQPAGDDGWFVLYTLTPTADPDEWIWAARLEPCKRGILVCAKRRRLCTVGTFTRGLDERMGRAMRGAGYGAE